MIEKLPIIPDGTYVLPEHTIDNREKINEIIDHLNKQSDESN